MCRIVQRNTASGRRENKAPIKGPSSRSAIRLRLGGGLVGTILVPLQERPERRHLEGLPRPGKTKALRKLGRIGRGEQFCTDAVGQQAYPEQRLGVYPPALLPVKPILQVSGPSRGWLSVWGSVSCCETRRACPSRRKLNG